MRLLCGQWCRILPGFSSCCLRRFPFQWQSKKRDFPIASDGILRCTTCAKHVFHCLHHQFSNHPSINPLGFCLSARYLDITVAQYKGYSNFFTVVKSQLKPVRTSTRVAGWNSYFAVGPTRIPWLSAVSK